MRAEGLGVGPLQLVIIGFETTERFRGEIARELLDLRGRGLIRVLEVRLLHRAPDGKLTEVDLGAMLAEPPVEDGRPLERLLGVNGAGQLNGGRRPPEAYARTAGFAVEDVRRLTEEVGPGDHAIALLVEHVWGARLAEAIRNAGGKLLGHGFLTREAVMVAGADIQARADAQAAVELAHRLRGSAMLEALKVIGSRRDDSETPGAETAADMVRVLTDQGFVHEGDTAQAIDALAAAGLIDSATLDAAVSETERALRRHRDEAAGTEPDSPRNPPGA
jgi:hypothetical protein